MFRYAIDSLYGIKPSKPNFASLYSDIGGGSGEVPKPEQSYAAITILGPSELHGTKINLIHGTQRVTLQVEYEPDDFSMEPAKEGEPAKSWPKEGREFEVNWELGVAYLVGTPLNEVGRMHAELLGFRQNHWGNR